MRELFRQEIPATAEKPEKRVLDARALFDMYKRSAGQEEVRFNVTDLMTINEAFRGNPTFEEDRAFIRNQLASKYNNQSIESKLSIIEHLIDDDPHLANQLIDKDSEQIKKDYLSYKNSAKRKDASWESRRAAERLETAIGKIVNKIASSEIEEKLGYENPLDETFTDRDYNKYKIRITHLHAPELKDFTKAPPKDQWKEVNQFLKQVEVPAQSLERWSGDDIDRRKRFLSERVNQAFTTGIEIIKQMPPAETGKRFLELCNSANAFTHQLEKHRSKREISLPLENIEDPEAFKAFIKERLKQEQQEERSRLSRKLEREEHKEKGKKQFEIELEHRLAIVGIERDIPELVFDEMSRLRKRMDELEIADIETVYSALQKRSETEGQYEPTLREFRAQYEQFLIKKISETARYSGDSGRSAALREQIGNRLSEFLNPSQEWDKVVSVFEAMKQMNDKYSKEEYLQYFPQKLIDKSVENLADLTDDQRKTRLTLLEDFCSKRLSGERYEYQAEGRFNFWADTLYKHGFSVEAAHYAASKNLKHFIVKVLQEGDETSAETLWKTKGWEPVDVLSELASKAQKQGTPALNSLLSLADRYRNSYGQIERDHYVAEDAEKIGKILQELITRSKSYGREYIPPFSAEESAKVQERINQYRSLSWELWQQGHIPYQREARQRVLKMFVEDGRDLAIAELGLGANQKVELFVASGKVAIDQKDTQTLKKAIDNAKRLKAYEQSEEARKLVADLEKDQEMLTLQTDVSKMDSKKIRILLDQSEYKEDILNTLIDSGRYHEAIILCGELGQERIA